MLAIHLVCSGYKIAHMNNICLTAGGIDGPFMDADDHTGLSHSTVHWKMKGEIDHFCDYHD